MYVKCLVTEACLVRWLRWGCIFRNRWATEGGGPSASVPRWWNDRSKKWKGPTSCRLGMVWSRGEVWVWVGQSNYGGEGGLGFEVNRQRLRHRGPGWGRRRTRSTPCPFYFLRPQNPCSIPRLNWCVLRGPETESLCPWSANTVYGEYGK
jgi:hypothetical protein